MDPMVKMEDADDVLAAQATQYWMEHPGLKPSTEQVLEALHRMIAHDPGDHAQLSLMMDMPLLQAFTTVVHTIFGEDGLTTSPADLSVVIHTLHRFRDTRKCLKDLDDRYEHSPEENCCGRKVAILLPIIVCTAPFPASLHTFT